MQEAGFSVSWKMLDKNGIEKLLTMRGETADAAADIFGKVNQFTEQAITHGWRPLTQGTAKPPAAPQAPAQAAQAATHTVPALAGAAKDASQIDTGGALNALQVMQGLTPANPASVPQG